MEHVMRNKWVMVLAVLAAMAGVGCGGSEDGDTPADTTGNATLDDNVDWTALELVYSPMYSAFDGQHTFQLPCYANGTSTDVEQWQAIPADAVSFAPWQNDDGSQKGVLITVEKSVPEVTIAVKNGSIGGKASLFITDATPAQWQAGADRYVKGNMFDLAQVGPQLAMMVQFVDGMPVFMVDGASLNAPTDLRCDSCHTAEAPDFQVEHTPTQAARFSDAELINIFSKGMKPPGVGYRALPPMFQDLYAYFHTWDVTDEQSVGLTIYLRSLTPKGQGDIKLPGSDILVGSDVDLSGLPDACNPQGGSFDLATCMMMLPAACMRGSADFDIAACGEALGIDLGMFGMFGMGPAPAPAPAPTDTMMDDMMDDTMETTDAGMMMDDTMETTDAGMGM